MKKKIHLLPNALTAFGLTCGLFIIFKMNMTEVGEVSESLLIAISGLLLLAGFFDVLDGAVARAINATSEFGGLFDSLADAVTFGVAPSVIVLKSLSVAPATFDSFLITTAALLFSMCGVLRLVRFSVSPGVNASFTGLPIPGAAVALVALNQFLISSDVAYFVHFSRFSRVTILSTGMFILGYFMVSRWKFPSVKNLRFRVKNFQLVFYVVLAAVIMFYGILNHFSVMLFILSWGYLLSFLTIRKKGEEVLIVEHE